MAVLNPHEQPPHPPAERLDNIPDVNRVPQRLDAAEPALLGRVLVFAGREVRAAAYGRVEGGLGVVQVRAVRESPEVEDGKDGHFEAQEQRGDAHFKVRVCEDVTRLDEVEG